MDRIVLVWALCHVNSFKVIVIVQCENVPEIFERYVEYLKITSKYRYTTEIVCIFHKSPEVSLFFARTDRIFFQNNFTFCSYCV